MVGSLRFSVPCLGGILKRSGSTELAEVLGRVWLYTYVREAIAKTFGFDAATHQNPSWYNFRPD